MTIQQQSRNDALDRYYAEPNICRGCGQVIVVPANVKVSVIRIKQFCTRACANAYNNPRHTKRPKQLSKKRSSRPHLIKASRCQLCNRETLSSDGRRKYCEQCYQLYRFPDGTRFEEVTKGDLFRRRCNWQSARSSIRNHASRVFSQSGLPLVCHICGYFHHVQIAHRRPVSDFPDSAIMKEINDVANLIALCPNHHWELDHGILQL